MGITNLRLGLEQRLARHKGDLNGVLREIETIEANVDRLAELYEKAQKLQGIIASVEDVIRFDYPSWQTAKVKPVQTGRWKSPFKNGEQGRMALTILREDGGWMSCNELATEMLGRIGYDADDRVTRERIANTLLAYMKKHCDDLVEMKDEYPKKWRVIR